ncbi:alpha/beta hydrolase [Breoghania sp. L-A4]|nr:alpha/beta hydrolase [Breoghania sp. L-A4]
MTLVFIPGLLSDAVVWQHAADRLSRHLPVAIADVSAGDSITGMAETILGEHAGPLLVAGHSMGARVALEMYRLAPQRVRALALADTGIHPRQEGEEAKRQKVLDLARNEGMAALAAAWLPPMLDQTRLGDTELLETLTAMVLRADVAQHDRQIGALLNRPDAEAALSDVTCPVLLVVGRQDIWSPPAQHEDMLNRLERARLEIIDDAGHFAPIERPEAVTAALESWVLDILAAKDTA